MRPRRTQISSLLLLCLMSLMAVPASALRQYRNPVPGRFPILAWYSIMPDSALTRERYLEMADCGFNISFSHIFQLSSMKRALNACRGTGVTQMVTGQLVGELKGDSMVSGWFLQDEPPCAGFPALREFRDQVLAEDTTRVIYLNLLPNYVAPEALGTTSYREYLEQFTREVDLGLISYDNYPIVMSGDSLMVKPQFYGNLEDALAVSRSSGQPFWAFALTTAHGDYPVATSDILHLEVFSNLAYGAQGIQYFTYWNPGNQGTWNFHTAPISLDGQRTHVWYLLRDINREIQALTPVFLGAKVVSVGHTGAALPVQTHRLTHLPAPFHSVEASGQGVLVSHLQNGKAHYLLILNRDINHAQTVTVKRSRGLCRILSCGCQVKDHVRQDTFSLRPGHYLLFGWK